MSGWSELITSSSKKVTKSYARFDCLLKMIVYCQKLQQQQSRCLAQLRGFLGVQSSRGRTTFCRRTHVEMVTENFNNIHSLHHNLKELNDFIHDQSSFSKRMLHNIKPRSGNGEYGMALLPVFRDRLVCLSSQSDRNLYCWLIRLLFFTFVSLKLETIANFKVQNAENDSKHN